MKVVLLAGGYGTRISEESTSKPKPMIEVGNRPLLWHVMRNFYRFGYDEFIICAGYKHHMINNYFAEYLYSNSDITFNFKDKSTTIIKDNTEDWSVTVINTGLDTMTGGRIKRIEELIGNERFLMSYGDGVSDVDISKLVKFHEDEKNLVTLTAVKPQGRFGVLNINENNKVVRFAEKAKEDVDWINGGFMVMEPEIFSHIRGDEEVLERYPLEKIAEMDKLGAYLHKGYWHCVDSMKDKQDLELYLKTNTTNWI